MQYFLDVPRAMTVMVLLCPRASLGMKGVHIP